ncbi:DNA-binding protein [Halorientalis halophila]|uniref:DNA-binding protein n=1 Tax=Halorientalis halophila TaxID=3108499 RepID=UPI003AB340EF
MSDTNPRGNEVSSVAQAVKHVDLDVREPIADEQALEDVVEEKSELRPSVEQEIQGKVDTNHPDATPEGLTLEAEERMQAREAEISRTFQRVDRRVDSDREKRTQAVARSGSIKRRRAFEKRAASVDPWADPDREDARLQLSRAELAKVNQEAARVSEELRGWSRAAISRRIAERVADGVDVASAVMTVFEELQMGPGQVIPIAALERVDAYEVSIRGEVVQLWQSDSAKIHQVGLLDDGSGRTKFTSWVKSEPKTVEEGDRVVLRNVVKNWYQGRCSVAVTGSSMMTVSE